LTNCLRTKQFLFGGKEKKNKKGREDEKETKKERKKKVIQKLPFFLSSLSSSLNN